jgi:hypothetical protein
LAVEFDATWHDSIANQGTGTRALDNLRHRLFGAHAVQNGIRADSVGQLLDPIGTRIAALGDDVGRLNGPTKLAEAATLGTPQGTGF